MKYIQYTKLAPLFLVTFLILGCGPRHEEGKSRWDHGLLPYSSGSSATNASPVDQNNTSASHTTDDVDKGVYINVPQNTTISIVPFIDEDPKGTYMITDIKLLKHGIAKIHDNFENVVVFTPEKDYIGEGSFEVNAVDSNNGKEHTRKVYVRIFK